MMLGSRGADSPNSRVDYAEATPRPLRVEVNFDKIPHELADREQWVVWRYELKDDK